MKNVEKRLKLFKLQKWIVNSVIIAVILMAIYCFWPFILMLGLYTIPIAAAAICFLLFAVLFKAYKYFSNKNTL
ncbi:hypothetical protein [Oscillibacter sp.]|uniref:hypothetical protein n=1 Tax=Oscillibacter sp. TaxID=1945593 RepID=UPI00289D6873|nr:hypothetical protein [Oscillibacter sp.]